ncbi:MAG: MFS transporter [Acidobacteriota bacterium]|nr:MFS transporter [Acidobacteriota bacterium]
MNLTYAQLLKGNRDFRNLFWGQIISELGNWFNFIAGLGLIRVVSDSSPAAAGIFVVCRTLPFSLLMPLAGTFVDRFSRRQVMIWADLARVFVALMFLLVTKPENLWIAYLATTLLSAGGAFFEAAKNAATPNISGKEGLFAGTALMFSSRFLLMAIGSALAGLAAAYFGYQIAFIINAASFLVSAYSVWLIPEESVREPETAERKKHDSFFGDLKEGMFYFWREPFVMTIVLMNIIWATGGGAINIVFERLGGVAFPQREAWNPDLAVALLWVASGLGLAFGMFIAHRVNSVVERKNVTTGFIGWSLIVHGLLFSVAGFMPSLWLVLFFAFISRLIVGVEYAVQETMLQRALPDYIRGRILTIDRGAEITMFSVSGYLAGVSQYYITPEMLTIISGVLSASAGVLWFARSSKAKVGNSETATAEA